MTSGAIFAMLTLAHIWRIIAERHSLATEPDFVLITIAAASMSGWAFFVLSRRKSSSASRSDS